MIVREDTTNIFLLFLQVPDSPNRMARNLDDVARDGGLWTTNYFFCIKTAFLKLTFPCQTSNENIFTGDNLLFLVKTKVLF